MTIIIEKKDILLFEDRKKFAEAIENPAYRDKYNEVLARMRWNTDGTSKVIIGRDTLESRLLAQDYARIIRQRINERAKEMNQPVDENYQIPICYYLPNDPKHFFSLYIKRSTKRSRSSAKYL